MDKKWTKRGQKACSAHRDCQRLRPRHRHARTVCAAHRTRARACRTRSTRTLHACAPRRRRTCSHAATRGHTSKARMPCSHHWPLAARRPPRRWHIWRVHAAQMRSPPPLRASLMHHRHAVPCHPSCITDTLCMPSTTMRMQREDMIMTTNDINTMQKTENTMNENDASECALPAPVALTRQVASASTLPTHACALPVRAG